MAKLYGKNPAVDFAGANLMSFGKSFSRLNGQPLDKSEVWYNYQDLVDYAKTDAAYVGQKVFYVEMNEDGVTGTVNHYSIEVDGSLKSLGQQEINITVTDDDVINLEATGTSITASHAKKGPEGGAVKGATADASVSTFGGSIEFKVPHVTVDEYGHTTALDEKTVSIAIPAAPTFTDTNTTYGFVFDKETQKLTVTPSEGEVVELDLSDFLIASELPEDKNTEYHLEYSTDDKAIKLVAGADASKMSIDATPFIKDGMLSDVEYDAASNTLTFVWNTDSGLQADTVVLSDILDPYVAGDKIVIDGSKISHAKQTVSAGETGERTYVTNITYDDYGHITGFTTGKETVVDTNDNDTYSAGNGIVVSDADENDNHTVSVKIAANEERLSFAADGGLQVDVSGINTDTNDTYVSGDGIDIRDEGDLLHSVHIKLADGETHLSVDENGLAINLEDHVTKEQAGMNNIEKPGIRFINQEEINKLSALSLDGEDVTISGSVEAAQVKGLYAVIKNIVTNTPSTEDFDSEAEGVQQALGIEAGAQKNVINTTSDDFQVVEGKLLLTKEYVTTNVYQTEVGDLSQLIRTKGDNSTLVEEINAINERLTWMEIGSAE